MPVIYCRDLVFNQFCGSGDGHEDEFIRAGKVEWVHKHGRVVWVVKFPDVSDPTISKGIVISPVGEIHNRRIMVNKTIPGLVEYKILAFDGRINLSEGALYALNRNSFIDWKKNVLKYINKHNEPYDQTSSLNDSVNNLVRTVMRAQERQPSGEKTYSAGEKMFGPRERAYDRAASRRPPPVVIPANQYPASIGPCPFPSLVREATHAQYPPLDAPASKSTSPPVIDLMSDEVIKDVLIRAVDETGNLFATFPGVDDPEISLGILVGFSNTPEKGKIYELNQASLGDWKECARKYLADRGEEYIPSSVNLLMRAVKDVQDRQNGPQGPLGLYGPLGLPGPSQLIRV